MSGTGGAPGRWRGVVAGMGVFPGQFWLIVAATVVFLSSSSLVFPFLSIYLHDHVHLSLGVVGAVLGLSALGGLPLQVAGGWWADRHGRRGVVLLSMASVALLTGALAVVHQVGLVVAIVLASGALGWPLFLTATNAMVGDLVPRERTAEAFGIVRVALNLGVVFGPMIAGFALAAGLSFAVLFGVSAAGCGCLFVLLALLLKETRPLGGAVTDRAPLVAETVTEGAPGMVLEAASEPVGYRRVLADRRFLAFCAITLLPLFCYGHISTVYPVFLTQVLHVSYSSWGLLLALNAIVVVTLQYPVVRLLQRHDRLLLVALASALLGCGIGAAAFLTAGWPLFALMIVFSLGEIVFVPLSTSIAMGCATDAERGRYMGVWSIVWVGGQALAPLLTGAAMDRLGGRPAWALIILAGVVGAALYVALARVERARPRFARSTVAGSR
jgi:MFS family permease